MYYYFSSEFAAVIKLNGIYYGQISGTVKHINIEDDSAFVEICSLDTTERSLNFLLSQEFLTSPPKSVCVTDLKGGYLIKFLKSFSVEEFKVIGQEKFSDLVITAFTENGYKLSIETPSDFYAEMLKLQFDSIKTTRLTSNGVPLVGIEFFGQTHVLAIFSLSGKIRKIFYRNVESCTLKDKIITEESFRDVAKHRLTCEWQIKDGSLCEIERKICRAENFEPSCLPKKLLPYAFVEELLIGGDYTQYLTDTVKANAQKLQSYFGDFIGVMPPPVFRREDEIGLIYRITENRYSVRYFCFEFINDKINNVIENG